MKAKMSYKSKKIAIITAVILVLIAAISVGTYFFVKGNDSAQAAYTENDNIAQTGNGQTDEAGNNNDSEEQTNPTDQTNENNDNQDEENLEDPIMPEEDSERENNGTVADNNNGNNLETNNQEAATDNDAEIPNEEYTQTDIVETEIERVEQEVRVGWSNIEIASVLANANLSTNISTTRPNLTTNKVAKIVNSLDENDNAIREGSKIIYEISITNNSTDVDATGINVSDIVPEGTKIDTETPVSNNGTVDGNKISWVIDISRNSTVTVSFTVVVEANTTEISNTAVVDGKNTPEVINPIVEAHKISTSTAELLEEGSEITYTISVENRGKTTAKTTVKDIVPEGTTLVDESLSKYENVTVEEENGQKTLTWKNVEVAAGETVKLDFTVTINQFEGESIEIRNTATVGDTPTEEVHDIAKNYYYKIEYYKDSIKKENKIAETELTKELYGTNITDEKVVEDFGENWINAKRPEGYKDGIVEDTNGELEGYITIDIENNVIKVVYEKEEVKEPTLTVIPTKTEPVPQRAVLVLDFSSTMEGSKIKELKEAVNIFLEEFLKPDKKGNGTTGNEVVIIEYDSELIKDPIGPSSNIKTLDISEDKTGRGTNIDLGLTVAYDYISKDNKITSVILMSDGVPYDYIAEDGSIENDSQTKAKEEAIASANKIKQENINLYTIGFHMSNSGEELMKTLANVPEMCHSASNKQDLKKAFQDISKVITTSYDGTPITNSKIKEGIAEITDGFTEGQNVEIYTETYIGNTTKPFETYTWKEFTETELKDYVTYKDGTITFNLKAYMTNKSIKAETPITIRFANSDNSSKN